MRHGAQNLHDHESVPMADDHAALLAHIPPGGTWRRDEALGVLLEAEQLAPEQIKHHAISRQLVLSWLRNHRGPRSVPLDQLARRLHLV